MADGFFDKFLGAGSLFEQLFIWNVAGQLVGAAMGPMITAYMEKVNAGNPVVALSPGDLADAVVRDYMDQAAAAAEAAMSGVDAARFATMVHLHADAPGPQQLVEALLRGLIPVDGSGPDSISFAQGIREGRLADKWTGMMRQLGDAVLSPADLAAAVLRNFMAEGEAEAEAAKSGVSAAQLATLRHLSGDAPGPQQLAEALRRALIPRDGAGPDSTSFEQGIAEGRLADKWGPVIEGLAQIWPTPADALRATLNGQVTMDQGRALYAKLGGDPQFFQVMFDTEGSAPTPLEAADMARRGIIPWDGTGPGVVSFEQAFKEGPWRDKWATSYRDAAAALPTTGEITEFLRYGIIDKPAAAKALADRGVTGDYATWVLDYAEAVSTYDFRGLTMSSVMNALSASIITADNAKQILSSMHMSDQAIGLLVGYTQVQKSVEQTSAAISHIGSLYTARKIAADTARKSLATLGLDAAAAADIMQTWDLEAAVTVRTLTEAQIVDAWSAGVLDDGTAITEMANIGYTPFDAWVLLSTKAKAPLPGMPPQGPAPALPVVIPGATG